MSASECEEIENQADDIAQKLSSILISAFKDKEGRDPTNEEIGQLFEELTEERIIEMLSDEGKDDYEVKEGEDEVKEGEADQTEEQSENGEVDLEKEKSDAEETTVKTTRLPTRLPTPLEASFITMEKSAALLPSRSECNSEGNDDSKRRKVEFR